MNFWNLLDIIIRCGYHIYAYNVFNSKKLKLEFRIRPGFENSKLFINRIYITTIDKFTTYNTT